MFSVECNQINVMDIDFSSVSASSNMDVWCTDTLLAQIVTNTFSEPVYLLYAVIRGNGVDDVTRFSLSYENLSGARVLYVNVDGINVRQLTVDHKLWLFSYAFYSCLENNMTLMIITLFCCGHQSILAEYSSLILGILPLLIV